MTLHLAILRGAGLFVPAPQRAEWFAEWSAELCYINRRCDSRPLGFCLGAFKDAFWFRRQCHFGLLESPGRCLLLLGILAAAGSLGAGRTLLSSPFRDARGLVAGHAHGPLAGGAFFRRINEPVVLAHGPMLFSIIQASGNLFDVLNVPVPRVGREPVLILNREAWRSYPARDRPRAGQVLEIAGRKIRIAGMISDDSWPFPGQIDAWLLEDDMPAGVEGTVVARAARSASAQPQLRPPPRRLLDAFGMFLVAALFACLIAPATTSFPARGVAGVRWWAFLLAKIALLMSTVYSCASLGFSCETPFAAIFMLAAWPGGILAVRWALTDQQRRCPVCLRPLSNPVRFGKASQTFLGWYGTELMCSQGHGVLRVPEIAGNCCSEQRWVKLDELCLQS